MTPEDDATLADVLLCDPPLPYRITDVVRYHALKHHQEMGLPVVLLHDHTWDSLDEVLCNRFPPHIWHPDHWPLRAEATWAMPSPIEETPTPEESSVPMVPSTQLTLL